MSNHQAIIIMGVSGSGKSTIGKLLSEQLHWPFFDGDDYHSEKNIAKMKSGTPLNDTDRAGWLQTLHQLIQNQLRKGNCILACSALKQVYRNSLSQDIENKVQFIYLNGSFEQVHQRHANRINHFIPTSLLQSQFEVLETPTDAIAISIMQTPTEIVDQIISAIQNKSAIGIIGLGVMGKSLCRNFASKGIIISMFNRHVDSVEENIAIDFKNQFDTLSEAKAFDQLIPFINSLASPKKVLLMIPAGEATTEIIHQLATLLNKGDVIIDGGNAFYQDSMQRNQFLNDKGIHFIGCGISGGEEGALLGPSMMPGGDKAGYEIVESLLNAVAAKDNQGNPCSQYIGKGGAGHFVKMVHNGIEYAEMQLLAELYLIAKASSVEQDVFAAQLTQWQKEGLDSYLLNITIEILREKENGQSFIEQIIDVADSKGTGTWATVETSMEGVPATMLTAALMARHISSYKNQRTVLSRLYENHSKQESKAPLNWADLKSAYHLASILNHCQGFWFIQEQSTKYQWGIQLSEVARIWTNGCIIRSALMQELVGILKTDPFILTHPSIVENVKSNKKALVSLITHAMQEGIATPCFSEAIQFLNGMTTEYSGANLIQAQRDYFGAHTFQKYHTAPGMRFHHQWNNGSK